MNKLYLILLLYMPFSVFSEVLIDKKVSTPLIKVGTYNIASGEIGGIERVVLAIKDMSLDIVGLQEVDNMTNRSSKYNPTSEPINQAKYIADKLGMNFYFCKATKMRGGEYGTAILSKYPLALKKRVELPNIGKTEQRSACAIEIEVPNYPAPIIAVTTHLDYTSQEIILAQVRDLRSKFSAWKMKDGLPVIIGDLNLYTNSEAYNDITAIFTDTDKHSLYTGPSWNPDRKIDYILTSNAQKWAVSSVWVPKPSDKVRGGAYMQLLPTICLWLSRCVLLSSRKKDMMVSILMSIYYKENPDYFNQAMESIWDKQSLKPDEIILVKDGPLTKALDVVIASWEEKLGGALKIIELSKNLGTGGAKHIGVEHCSGDLIAIVDTDDICTPERFERQVEFLTKNPDIDAVGTWLSEIDENGNIIKEKVEYPLTHKELFQFFKKRDPIAHPTAMMRRSFFEKAGNYRNDLFLAEDTLLWYEGFKNNCQLANIDYVGLLFRRNDAFYQRRGNWQKTIGLLKFRLFKINRDLGYGLKADLYAIAYFLMSVSPSFIKKLAYKILR